LRQFLFFLGLLIVGLAFVSPLHSAGPTKAEDKFLDLLAATQRGDCGAYNRILDQWIAAGETGAFLAKGTRYEYGECAPKDPAKAAEYYAKAIQRNSDYALYYLGYLHLKGLGVSHDKEAAKRLFRRAVLRLVGLGRENRLKYVRFVMDFRGLPKDLTKALGWLARLERGGVGRKIEIARHLLAGSGGLRRDRLAAYLWLKRASAQGLSQAAGLLAREFATGPPADPQQPSRNPARIKDNQFRFELGKARREGDCATFNRLLDGRIAAGDKSVMLEKGWNHERGLCVPRDFAKAADLYRRSEGFGDRLSIFLRADLHRRGGAGLPRDENEARRLYHVGLLRMIGFSHAHRLRWLESLMARHGLTDLSRRALDWMRELDPGDGPGRLAIARKLRDGTGGMPRDAAAARAWLEAAAKVGSVEAKRELAN
jgi:hypothetical protein